MLILYNNRHIVISQTILILNSKDRLYETLIKLKFSSRCGTLHKPLHMQVRTLPSVRPVKTFLSNLQEANNSANARDSGKLRNYRLVLTSNGRWKEYSVLDVCDENTS
jgi:hypothetical protein